MLLYNNISRALRATTVPFNFTTPHNKSLVVFSQQQSQQPVPITITSTSNYSISDESLASRGFSFHRTIDNLNLDHLNSVFVAVGFPKRDADKVRVALEHTDALLWVEYEKTKRPVAFARATGVKSFQIPLFLLYHTYIVNRNWSDNLTQAGDGVFNSIIWDVVVDPSFQGIGLGKAVMERLVSDLLEKGITNIALYSEPRVLGFYRPLGFVADPDGIRGMVYSRKNKNR